MKKLFYIICLLAVVNINEASALPEICGNGLDENGDGIDLDCPEPDKDNDSYFSLNSLGGNDCDDSNYKIYPGVVTADGCPIGETRKCQLDGSYSECSSEVVCEVSPGSTCKYIDCQSGDDSSGDGSFNNPWKSLKMVGYYDSAVKPNNWYQVQAGDVIYLKGSGRCSDYYSPGGGYPNTMLYVAKSGTAEQPITFKRYPGSAVVLDPPFNADSPGHIIQVTEASYLKFEDLELTDSYGAMIYLTDTKYIEIARTKCHNSLGSTFDNIACINASGNILGNYFHHNEFFDIYDPTNPGSENISLIVLFKGQDNRVEYNRLYYSNEPNYGGSAIGRCFKYKHPSLTGTGNLSLKGNQMWNCYHTAVDNSTAGLEMQYNLFVNPDSYAGAVGYNCGDIGAGISYCRDALIEYNTFINFRPISFRNSVNSGLGTTIIQNNIAVDNVTSYNTENGFYRIERYGSDADYLTFLSTPGILVNNNCYYNSYTNLFFDFFGDSPFSTGEMCSFNNWQSSYKYDMNSQVENPNLDQYFRSASENCNNYGWRTNLSPSTTSRTSTSSTTTTTDTTIAETTSTTSTTLAAPLEIIDNLVSPTTSTITSTTSTTTTEPTTTSTSTTTTSSTTIPLTTSTTTSSTSTTTTEPITTSTSTTTISSTTIPTTTITTTTTTGPTTTSTTSYTTTITTIRLTTTTTTRPTKTSTTKTSTTIKPKKRSSKSSTSTKTTAKTTIKTTKSSKSK